MGQRGVGEQSIGAQEKGSLAWPGERWAGRPFWKSVPYGPRLSKEPSGGRASQAEETALQRHEEHFKARVSRATSQRSQMPGERAWALSRHWGDKEGLREAALRSDFQSQSAAPLVREV